MSIPDRLWRIAKGQWALANERAAQAEEQAEAYRELADALRQSPPVSVPAARTPSGVPPLAHTPAPGAGIDPLQAAYSLLQLSPDASLAQAEAAFEQRKAELHPEYYAAGSPERALQEGKLEAFRAAYEKLRDALNPTETRFERLEF
jgi:hypothetical protein